jgi:plasmid stability protein
MPSLLQIRNVPDATRRSLKARAAAQGESLNTYLLRVIARDVERPTAAEVFARAALRSERSDASALGAIDAARSENDVHLTSRRDA